MSNFKCTYLIVEDDVFSQIYLESILAKYDFLECKGVFSSAQEALKAIDNGIPDIIFSDVEMEGMNGIEMMRLLKNQNLLTVFITSHPEYAIEGFEVDAFDYILKPISEDRIGSLIAKIQEYLDLRRKAFMYEQDSSVDTIYVKQGYQKSKVVVKDILFLEAMKDYTRIRTIHGENLLILETLTNMLQQLPQDKFARIHRSYVVNKELVTSIASNMVQINNYKLPIGKSFKSSLKDLWK